MQFGGQHPGGLSVPAVGMAFPGYVAQPQLGMGNSEMTWYSNSFPVQKFLLCIWFPLRNEGDLLVSSELAIDLLMDEVTSP